MNVLHVIQRFPPAIGGAEAWCEGVARHSAGRGHRVEVLTLRVLDEDELWGGPPRDGEVAVGSVDLTGGFRVRRAALSPTPYALVRAGERVGLRLAGRYSTDLFGLALAAARRADVVHLHHSVVPSSVWGWLAARLARRPAVLTPHFHPGDPLFEQPVSRWLLRRCDAVIAVSPREGELLRERGVHAARIVVASNAIDPTAFAADPAVRARVRARLALGPNARLVTFLGRKAAQKDLPVLVEAARRVAATADLALVLAGPPADDAKPPCAPAGTSRLRVVDLPAVPHAAKAALLAASDVLVQPSPREAFGIVFLEAWASGVPVIGAAAGAIPEVVGDGGLTFTPGDAADLAQKLAWLLTHAEEARAMAARGRARTAREHTWGRVGDAVEEAYAIAARSRAPRTRSASSGPAIASA